MSLPRRISWASLALVALSFALVWWQMAASSRLAADNFRALQQVRQHGHEVLPTNANSHRKI